MGYLLTWLSGGVVRGTVLSPTVATVTPPTTLGAATASAAVAAWASGQQRYLVVWVEDASTPQVWAEFVDAELAPIGAPMELAGNAHAPKVASDGNSFWVVFSDPTAASQVSGVHVTDTQVTPFAIIGSGGIEVSHDVVVHDGNVDVLWFERGGSGPPLWAVPACTLGT